MNRIVRFLLSDGQTLQVYLPAANANRIVRAWKSGEWERDKKDIISSDEYPPGDLPWAVKVASIQCVHVIEIPQQQVVPAAFDAGVIGRSGRN